MARELWNILRNASPETQELNRHLLDDATKTGTQTHASESPAEAKFLQMWRLASLPEPEREYRFTRQRKWRFDFAWPDALVAVEIEGGQWVYGRHNRPAGYAADAEKYNNATALGWRIFRFTPAMITPANLEMVRETIEATA